MYYSIKIKSNYEEWDETQKRVYNIFFQNNLCITLPGENGNTILSIKTPPNQQYNLDDLKRILNEKLTGLEILAVEPY